MRIVKSSLSILFTLAMFGACSQDKAPPLTPAAGTAAQPQRATAEQAMDAIANARCNREQRCGNIGPDKQYSSREHCMTAALSDLRESLADCQAGVDENDVRQCAGEIETQGCSGPFEGLETFIACKTDDLCEP